MEKQVSKKRPPPISVRCTNEQRTELRRRASKANLSVSGYIKFVALEQSPRKLKCQSYDRALLAKVLAHILRVGNNLNQIARRLNMDCPVEIPEMQTALNHHSIMHFELMRALGYRGKTLKVTFNQSAGSHDY